MKRFPVIAALAVVLAVALAMGGCGGSEGGDKDTGGSVEEVKADVGPAEVAPEEVAPEEVAPEDKVTPPLEEIIADVGEDTTPVEDVQEDTGPPPIDVVEDLPEDLGPEDIPAAEIVPGTACMNDADKAIAADAGAQAKMTTCTKDCYWGGEDIECINACIETETGLSADCSACFGLLAECTVLSCAVCVVDASTQECADCRNEKCSDPMLECSGIDISEN